MVWTRGGGRREGDLEVWGPVANPEKRRTRRKGCRAGRGPQRTLEGVQHCAKGSAGWGLSPGSFPHTHASAMKALFAAVKSG